MILSREALMAHCAAGGEPKYLFFWGHRPRRADVVDKSCLSQWFEAAFELDGVRYASAEHYMMAEKARLFDDTGRAEKILAAPTPGAAKALGREVLGFSPEVWDVRRFDIVVAGNLAKFSQNPALSRFLLGTGERVLVEASPQDAIWGIGLAATDPCAGQPAEWPGLNLLGFALMRTRRLLREGRGVA